MDNVKLTGESVSVTYKVSLQAAQIEAVGSVSGQALQVGGGDVVGPTITVQGTRPKQ